MTTCNPQGPLWGRKEDADGAQQHSTTELPGPAGHPEVRGNIPGKGHPDYDGEVDHKELIGRLCAEYDGWILHTSSVALAHVLSCVELAHATVRVMSWVKPFAAFKRNVSVAYAWEPVIVQMARKPVVKPGMTYRDWIAEPITLKRGLTGAKPAAVCRWAFEVCGAMPHDELHDLYPGTGAVADAWNAWRGQMRIEDVA